MEEKRNRASRENGRETRVGSERTHREAGSTQWEGGAYREDARRTYGNPEEEGYYGNGQGQQQYHQGHGGYYQNGPQQQGYYQNGPQQGYYQEGPQQQGYYQEGPQQGYYQEGQQGYYEDGGQSYYQSQGNPNMYQGQPFYQEPDPRTRGRRKKKKKRRKLIFVELVLMLVVALGLFAFAQLSRVGRVNLKDIVINSGIAKRGYRNIALFGVDSRKGDLDSGTNSDTIMVCSINNKSGEIKLVSVYRDTYLDVNDGQYAKANSAYAGGGPGRAVNMLNKNLDLDITDFVAVDFNAVIKAVDLLGGIDIDLTDEEVKWLNAYLVETSQVTGVSYENVASSGTQHLSGIQAMAYCRIRYTDGWDYKRTERQRLVLEKIFAAAQAQGVTGLAGLINTMIPYIKTSLSNTEMLALAANIGKYSIGDTQGFPYDKQAADVDAGDCVVPVNLASNVSQLHSYLFGESDYTPSDTVQQISNQIINNTGIQ